MSLHVAELGSKDAKPVLFLHGAAATGWMWRRQTRILSADLRCVVVDLPGHGESTGVPWTSLDDAAAGVAEIIRARIGAAAEVVGISLGGYVALRLAMAHTELVSGAILSGVSVLPASLGSRIWQRGQIIARYTGRSRMVPTGSRALGVAADDVPPPRTPSRPMPRRAVLKVAEEVVGFELPHRRDRIGCTVLAVAGEHESREVLTSLRPLADRFQPSWAKYVPEAGHGWNAEQPELFNAMVQSWVSERRLPPKLRDPEQWSG